MSVSDHSYLSPINFSKVNKTALDFTNHLEQNFEKIADVLLEYESFEVVQDEYNRTMDLFRSLEENKDYFALRVGEVTSFLPRNQPLYAFSCFVILPSLMSTNVHFRIPHSTRSFFPQLLQVLEINKFFPNIIVSKKERLEFLEERTALLMDPETKESVPVTDVVIFTGTPNHAEKLRHIFDLKTLFISNGSGHNPIVVAENSNMDAAVAASIKLQLYNQGQDCAAPNSVLVHASVYKSFLSILRNEISKVKIGPYRDRLSRVGPISEAEDLKRIEELLVDNRVWIDQSTKGVIRTADTIVEPTIICKPLKDGGNFKEVFAPIFFVQEYETDDDLSIYFEDKQYAKNAMYVTLYGDSVYIQNLVNGNLENIKLHTKETFLHNTHLHASGVERGTQPYGGYGLGASSISLNGKIIPRPTCPQRDIYEYLVKPLIEFNEVNFWKEKHSRATNHLTKNISKLMGLKLNSCAEHKEVLSGFNYLDLQSVKNENKRYIEITSRQVFNLLEYPNAEIISRLNPTDQEHVNILLNFLKNNKEINLDEFTTFLYAITKKAGLSEKENTAQQLHFFQNIYQLLFGKEVGPRLPQFLIDADREKIYELLNVHVL